MALKLIVGNKNYSSWSFRPWIAMKVAGIRFEEEVISLNADDFKQRVSKISGTGKVPALADGSIQVWESLATCGRATRQPARSLARSRPRCMRASFRCAAICP
jgi:glutathione S-transferase